MIRRRRTHKKNISKFNRIDDISAERNGPALVVRSARTDHWVMTWRCALQPRLRKSITRLVGSGRPPPIGHCLPARPRPRSLSTVSRRRRLDDRHCGPRHLTVRRQSAKEVSVRRRLVCRRRDAFLRPIVRQRLPIYDDCPTYKFPLPGCESCFKSLVSRT